MRPPQVKEDLGGRGRRRRHGGMGGFRRRSRRWTWWRRESVWRREVRPAAVEVASGRWRRLRWRRGGFGGGGGGARGWSRNRAAVNRIRGNFMEQYTNSGFDAHPYPLNVAESPQIPAYRETFGFSLGGPLVIPHVYRGGNKTSWFASYNLQRGRTGLDSFSTVPTAAERQGNFSDTVIASGPYAGTVPTIYDPLSSATGARTPFTGNVIPTLRLNSAATGLLTYIPLPNLPGEVQNFHLQVPLPSSNDRVMGRIGQQINSKNSLNVMYYFNSSRSQSVGNVPQLSSHTSVRGQNLSVGESHTFNSHLVNTFTLNFNRQRTSTLNAFAYQEDIAAELGITGVSTNPFDWGVPAIGFTNFGGVSDTLPSLSRPQTIRASETLIWSHGKHNFHMGGELRRVQAEYRDRPQCAWHLQLHRLRHQQLQQRISRARHRL